MQNYPKPTLAMRWIAISFVAILFSINIVFSAPPIFDAVVTIPNVAEVKASQSLTVVSLPANATTSITIGTCVVSFLSTPGSTIDELNCADGVATLDRDTDGTNDLRTADAIA